MAIAMVRENVRLPVIGKIRLGIRKETDRGTEYPESVPHFVLHDAPDLEKVIGKTATEFDCFFLTDDIDEAIPNWYKWYSGGKRDKAGNIVGGDLKCYGEGPIAVNDDGSFVPGVAHHIDARDKVTKIIPTRECLGEKCKDFLGANGRAQCGPSMTVNVFIPEASLYGIFTIDTKSKTSIGRFVNQLTLLKEQFGKIKGIPFTIYREPVSMKDPNGSGAKKTQYILSIRPNEGFFAAKGALIQARVANVMNQNLMGPAAQDMIGAPMEDNVAITHDEYEPKKDALESAQAIAEDPAIVEMFAKLAELEKTEAKNTPQQRLLNVRGFEAKNKGKDLRAGMVAALQLRISQAAAKIITKPDIVTEPVTEHPLMALFTELSALKGSANTPANRDAFAQSHGGDLTLMEADLLAKIAAIKSPPPPADGSPAPDSNGLI